MGAPLSRFSGPVGAQQTNLDMDQSHHNQGGEAVEFFEWHPEGLPGSHAFDVGNIVYDTSGTFRVELLERGKGAELRAELAFEAPLAIRIAGEGSLMPYWNAGFSVPHHNLFIASRSTFLSWLEASSSGVHGADEVKHYALFTDDVCVEVLSRVSPSFLVK